MSKTSFQRKLESSDFRSFHDSCEARTLDSSFRWNDSRACRGYQASSGMVQADTFMRDRQPCVYILANRRNATLYIGVTSELVGRVWQHRQNIVEGFTKRYSVHDLVWYELHDSMESAISREKAIKAWRRAWKIELVEKSNPYWRDLYPDICG